MLRLVRGDSSVSFGDLFKGFSKFLPLLLTFFMVTLATIVGFVLLVVPGVIIMLGLWPAYLLVMEDDTRTRICDVMPGCPRSGQPLRVATTADSVNAITRNMLTTGLHGGAQYLGTCTRTPTIC